MTDAPSFESVVEGEGGGPGPEPEPSTGPLDRLFDASAGGPEVPEIMRDYGLPRDLSMTARGILRVATGEGIPPIFEIVVGLALVVLKHGDESAAAAETPAETDETPEWDDWSEEDRTG